MVSCASIFMGLDSSSCSEHFLILFPCELAGLLHAGDRLVEVNGHPVFGLEPEQIIKILVRVFNSILTFFCLMCWM